MRRRILLGSGLAVLALLPIVAIGWIISLPPSHAVAAPAPIPQEETNATLAALKPPKRQRPLIAIVGINRSTELTDYLMPYGVLRRADVADVVALATGP